MARPAVMAGSVSIPIEHVNLAQVREDLTAKTMPMGADEPLEVLLYTEDKDYIHVPRQYGLTLCKRLQIEVEDRTSQGKKVKFPKIAKPRDYQVGPLAEVIETASNYLDFLWRARTGWGKTFGSLYVAAKLGVTTLVLVDQEKLKDQWIAALVNHFGFKVEDVGIIQGKQCSYEGKAVTIAMIQTLRSRTLPQKVYDYFGFVVVDEVHTIGAPKCSALLLRLSAAYRLGVSATPRRRDGLQKVLDTHLGKVRVYIDDEHEVSAVYIAQHPSIYSWYANKDPKIGRFLTEITEDSSRNRLVAESAVFLYETGRDVLVLSDRIEHLKHLMDLCYYMGVPAEDMGLYAGYHPTYGYAKDPKPARRPANLVKYEEAGEKPRYEYTPIKLQLIAKRIKKSRLQEIEANAPMIFGTYGMFSKGVDIPRLTGGVDASPRSQAEQVHGRILRGKMPRRPIWITILDWNSYRSVFSLASRLSGYLKNNAKLSNWSLEEGKISCDPKNLKASLYDRVETLKSSRIEPDRDGLNTLLKPETKTQAVLRRVSDIRTKMAALRKG